MSKIISKVYNNFDAKKNAFPYQTEAFDTIKDLNYSAIFHEQGLGKSKIAIDLMLYWLTQKHIDTTLIVTKKQLIANWENELSNHTHLKPRVLTSDEKNNYYIFNSPTKVIITNFETVEKESKRLALFLKTRNVAIIIDESTKLKNPESKLTKSFFELSGLFKIRTIMTGTPVANRPYDIWSQIYFLDQGESLGRDFKSFKKETDLSNKLLENEKLRSIFEDKVSNIFSKISKFSVRETKKSIGIQLPEKTYYTLNASFTTEQEKKYYSIINDLRLEINTNGISHVEDEDSALKRLLRLIQVTSNPKLLDKEYTETSGKEIVLDNLIQRIMANGEKCIVWSSFIENVDYLSKKYKQFNPRKIHGRMAISERNKSVSVFKEDCCCKILFATPQAAKEGLTLTIANHVIFYDRGFNLDDYLQAQDRIHRISQEKHCYVYNIITKDSIDEWIEKLLYAKQQAAFLTQGDITKQEYIDYANYTYAEILFKILNGDSKNGNN